MDRSSVAAPQTTSSDIDNTAASFLNIYTESSQRTPSDEHDAKEKRKEQNRVAQRKYRKGYYHLEVRNQLNRLTVLQAVS